MRHFSDTFIKGLKPKAERYEEYEGDGFGIRITPKNIKTWIYRYKIDGKTYKLTIGYYPHTSVANARKRFVELSGYRKEGINPKDVIQQEEQKKNDTIEKLVLE